VKLTKLRAVACAALAVGAVIAVAAMALVQPRVSP